MRFSHKDFDKMIEDALGEGEARPGGIQRLMDMAKSRLGIGAPRPPMAPLPPTPEREQIEQGKIGMVP